jgi:hypothetical protein
MDKKQSVWLGALALSAGLIAGCPSEPAAPPLPEAPAAGDPTTQSAAEPTGATPAAPTLPVAPAGKGAPTAKPPVVRSSFDGAPEGMPGVQAGAAPAAPDPMNPAGSAGSTAKPAPIRVGMVSKFRSDPFVSFYRLIVTEPDAYTLAAPMRLAAFPKDDGPVAVTRVEDMLPLPPVPRRVAGVLYNGAITAILETGESPSSDTRIIAPGAKVPSGVPGIADLTVDSIAMDRLVLRADDGRTVEVKLSGLSPAVLDAMRGQLGGGGAGMGGGGFGGGPSAGGFGGGGPAMGGKGAAGGAPGA